MIEWLMGDVECWPGSGGDWQRKRETVGQNSVCCPPGFLFPLAGGFARDGRAYYNRGVIPSENELLGQLAQEILIASERLEAEECLPDELPTAADLARRLNYRLETVKKKLRLLKAQGLIQPVSMTPKRYRFNRWALKSLDESHGMYAIFCEIDSPFYIEIARAH